MSDQTTNEHIRELFEVHGPVVEAGVLKNYGFIHMESAEEGKAAIEALNSYVLHGKVYFNNNAQPMEQNCAYQLYYSYSFIYK